jgi:hypothetical protein
MNRYSKQPAERPAEFEFANPSVDSVDSDVEWSDNPTRSISNKSKKAQRDAALLDFSKDTFDEDSNGAPSPVFEGDDTKAVRMANGSGASSPVFEDEDTKAVRMANARNYLVTGNFSVRFFVHALLNIA